MILNSELDREKKLLGLYLKRLRMFRYKITKSRLSELSGLTRCIINSIENGKNYHIDSYVKYKIGLKKVLIHNPKP